MEVVKKEAPTIISSAGQAIALYTLTPEKVALQLKEYDHLKVVPGDTKSYKAVRAAHTALVTTRTTGDKRRKKLGEDARKQVSFINKAWAMLLAPMTPYEDRFKAELKAEDDRKQAIKAEKEAIEQARIDDIQLKIEAIREKMPTISNLSSDDVATLCDEIVTIQITKEAYQEFTDQAKAVKLATLSALDDIYNEKVQTEKEDAARKAEIEKLEKIRKENEKAQAKIDREKAELKAEKNRADEKRWRFRLGQLKDIGWNGEEAIDRDTDKTIILYQDLIDFSDRTFEKIANTYNKMIAGRKREAKITAEKEAKREAEQEKQRIEKEKFEAEVEAKRQADLLPDKEKLIVFADTLNTLEVPIVKSEEARNVVIDIGGRLIELQSDIREQAEAL